MGIIYCTNVTIYAVVDFLPVLQYTLNHPVELLQYILYSYYLLTTVHVVGESLLY